jgi:hypothetical protein
MLVVNAKGTKLGHGLTLKSLKITQFKLNKRHHPLLLKYFGVVHREMFKILGNPKMDCQN